MGMLRKTATPHPNPLPQGERGKKGVARKLRSDQTDVEKIFWQKVKNRQIEQCKFRRQCPIDKYIVDFVCFEKRLVIELDGGQHCESEEDKIRDKYLFDRGFQVVRFWNNDVLANMDGVLMKLVEVLKESPSPLAGEGWGEGYDDAQN